MALPSVLLWLLATALAVATLLATTVWHGRYRTTASDVLCALKGQEQRAVSIAERIAEERQLARWQRVFMVEDVHNLLFMLESSGDVTRMSSPVGHYYRRTA